jgi:hypothetical protein
MYNGGRFDCVLSFTDKWEVCKGEVGTLREPLSYGPARRIAENKFYVVVGKKL